jgi:hypothetical protein
MELKEFMLDIKLDYHNSLYPHCSQFQLWTILKESSLLMNDEL